LAFLIGERRGKMKKLLVYLSTFLFLFGVSVAFAGILSEDFEDRVLGSEWYVNGDYEIIPVPGTGSMGLHPYRICDTCGSPTEVGTDTGELIYHFAADIYLPTNIGSNLFMDMDLFHWREGYESFELWTGIYFNVETGNLYLAVNLYDSDGQWVDQLSESLGPYNYDAWYSLSITINDGCVTFGIDGIETNLCDELIQKPDSGFCSARVAVSDVDYYVDNLVVYTSTGTTIDEVLESVEEWIDDGDLVGVGEGNSAAGRLGAFENMLENARDLFNADDIIGGCDQLMAASRKCDGESPPPDFVTGSAAEELRGMIETLMTDFECQ
jgi:hypothetical protein